MFAVFYDSRKYVYDVCIPELIKYCGSWHSSKHMPKTAGDSCYTTPESLFIGISRY